MIACSVQRKKEILKNTSDWICMRQNNTIDYFKQKWDNFEISAVYYKYYKYAKQTVQKLELGLNSVKEIPLLSEVQLISLV